MTKADNASDFFARLAESVSDGSAESIKAACYSISKFLERFCDGGWEIESLRTFGDHMILMVRSEKGPVCIEYTSGRNKWKIGNDPLTSDLDVSEFLGVSPGYLKGFVRAAFSCDANEVLANARDEHERMRIARARYQKKLDGIKESDVVRSAVKSATENLALENKRLWSQIEKGKDGLLSTVPHPSKHGVTVVSAASNCGEIPNRPGVYFAWDSGSIDYVGKSINMRARCRVPSHHVVKPWHDITWIEFPAAELDFAECLYIGLCRPRLNFGRQSKFDHRRAANCSQSGRTDLDVMVPQVIEFYTAD